MGRGGYNGGSTLIGPGRHWSFDPDFVFRDQTEISSSKKSRPRFPKPVGPTITIAGATLGARVLRKHRMAQSQQINRDEVLIALGHRLPKKPLERRAALKKLVAEKILLQTGAVNIGHPAVAAWLKRNGKKKKAHG